MSYNVGRQPFHARESFAGSFSNYDVIDPRIDVSAQKALIRLRGNPATSADAAQMLAAVKGERLQGIFGDDLRAAAQLAARLGTVRWELVPRGQVAALIREPNPAAPPTIIFRTQYRGDAARLDPALVAAWRGFGPTPGGGVIPISSRGRQHIYHRQLGDGWLRQKQAPPVIDAESFAPPPPFRVRGPGGDGESEIIGADGRQPLGVRSVEIPFRFVCCLDLTFQTPQSPAIEAGFRGSGTLISDIHVLTAAHNLVTFVDADLGGVPSLIKLARNASRVAVMPGRNGTPTLGSATAARLRVSPGYSNENAHEFDFGLITLATPIGASRHAALGNGQLGFWGHAQLGGGTRITAVAPNTLQLARANTSGYPGDKCLNNPPTGSMTAEQKDACADDALSSTQWLAEGRITNSAPAAAPRVMFHDLDTVGGQSGSPVWLAFNGFRFLVGINNFGFRGRTENAAVRITREVLDQLRLWMIEDGVRPSFN